MEPFENDPLVAALESLRPAPSPAFAAELDQRAAAGFPRRPGTTNPFSTFLAWLRSLSPRRLALGTAGTALAAIAIATVVVASQEPATDSSSIAQLSASDRPAATSEAQLPGHGASAQAGKTGAGGESSGIQYGGEVPTYGAEAPAIAGSTTSAGSGSAAAEASKPSTGPYAANAGHREIERSAELVLGAEPADVGEDAAAVFDAVHAADGIVLSSSVSGGAAGDAGARFALLIPSAKLSDALAAFSAIDLVVSRHEATDDITAPTVRTGELLRDSRAKIDGLLIQLAQADTDGERATAEAELRAERRHNAQLRSQLSGLQRRANLSRVSVRIETGAAATDESAGGWGVGDALGDAGHILGIAAGVTVVGLAILAPFALLALLAWLGNRARLRRARERTLA
jgi:Domain of unknown function (DUF4349)